MQTSRYINENCTDTAYVVCGTGSMILLSVRLSVCSSFPSFGCRMPLQWACCCGSNGQEILLHGRCSPANVSSVMSADWGSWTQTCLPLEHYTSLFDVNDFCPAVFDRNEKFACLFFHILHYFAKKWKSHLFGFYSTAVLFITLPVTQ